MRRLVLDRERLTELTPAELGRVAFGAPAPSIVLVVCAVSGDGCASLLEPCYESSRCSHPC